MDKESDRYRVCPNDGEEFMANDRGEVYCCPECADEYHNEKKRLAKVELKKKSLIEKETVLKESTQQIENEEKNLQILDQFDLKDNGSKFNMDFLYSLGFDFFSFNGKGILFNIDQQLNCHFIQIGSYRIFRVEFSEVLIKKII